MKNRFFLIRNIGIIVIVIVLLAGCGGDGGETPTLSPIPPTPEVNFFLNPNISDVSAGQTVALSVEASGQGLKFKWSVTRGDLSVRDAPAVIYTAPDTAGVDTVTVEVSSIAGTTTKSVTFNVIVQATDTPAPEDTPTPTAVPEAVVCDVPAITRDVFPQLEEVNKRFAFRGPVNDPLFECQGVYDIFHDNAMAVRIKYENVDSNFGFWGIGVPTDLPFDITPYRQICFWAYAQNPGQSFRLKMKDTSPPPNEDGPIIILGEANTWEPICTDLTEFSSLGIELDKLENINLGFEQPTGSAEIWVDDFELVK